MNAGLVGPWLALAGLGALHGLNPLGGWPLLACGGRGLVPMAAGHAASLLMVAAAVVLGVDRRWLLLAGVALPLMAVSGRWRTAGPGLSAFLASTIHGTGLMLVPALVPLCMAGTPVGEIVASGSWVVVLAAVGVHLTGMLVASRGAAAILACVLRSLCDCHGAGTRPGGRLTFLGAQESKQRNRP